STSNSIADRALGRLREFSDVAPKLAASDGKTCVKLRCLAYPVVKDIVTMHYLVSRRGVFGVMPVLCQRRAAHQLCQRFVTRGPLRCGWPDTHGRPRTQDRHRDWEEIPFVRHRPSSAPK